MLTVHNRHCHNWGIVTGLKVEAGFGYKEMTVREGIALHMTKIDGEDVSQEIILGKDLRIDLSSFDAGESVHIYISYDEGDIKNVLGTSIPVAWVNGLKVVSRSEIRELRPEEAHKKANAGIPSMIISKEFNHVAITAPNLQFNKENYKKEILPYDREKGCFTGNAGWENGMMYMNDRKGFGTLDWRNPDKVKYWQFRKYDGQFEV